MTYRTSIQDEQGPDEAVADNDTGKGLIPGETGRDHAGSNDCVSVVFPLATKMYCKGEGQGRLTEGVQVETVSDPERYLAISTPPDIVRSL